MKIEAKAKIDYTNLKYLKREYKLINGIDYNKKNKEFNNAFKEQKNFFNEIFKKYIKAEIEQFIKDNNYNISIIEYECKYNKNDYDRYIKVVFECSIVGYNVKDEILIIKNMLNKLNNEMISKYLFHFEENYN